MLTAPRTDPYGQRRGGTVDADDKQKRIDVRDWIGVPLNAGNDFSVISEAGGFASISRDQEDHTLDRDRKSLVVQSLF